MKKILLIIFCLMSSVLMASCNEPIGPSKESSNIEESSSDDIEKKYIDCSIKFAKDVNGEEEYTISEFPINTNIFVLVDFTFFNLDAVEDTIDFKVNLFPGVDTYSVYDYTKGPQEPTDVPHEEDIILGDDGIAKVIEISGMKFVLKSENAKKTYKYVFTIQASKKCDDCSFKAIFQSQDGFFNDGRSKSFPTNFKFI